MDNTSKGLCSKRSCFIRICDWLALTVRSTQPKNHLGKQAIRKDYQRWIGLWEGFALIKLIDVGAIVGGTIPLVLMGWELSGPAGEWRNPAEHKQVNTYTFISPCSCPWVRWTSFLMFLRDFPTVMDYNLE